MLIYHSVTPGYAHWVLLRQFWLRRRNQNSCMAWWGGQEADLCITWVLPCLSLSFPSLTLHCCLTLCGCLLLLLPLSESPLPHWQGFSFSSSLPVSFSLSFILCSFFLSQSLHHHITPYLLVLPLYPPSSSSSQSSSALAVSSTPRRTLFFNRGGDRVREGARYRKKVQCF